MRMVPYFDPLRRCEITICLLSSFVFWLELARGWAPASPELALVPQHRGEYEQHHHAAPGPHKSADEPDQRAARQGLRRPLCVLSTLLWARIAARFANKASPIVLNRATGAVLVVLGGAILIFNPATGWR